MAWVRPAIIAVLTILEAIVNVLAIWPGRQRSVMNIVSTVLVVPSVLFFTLTFTFVGEAIGGA